MEQKKSQETYIHRQLIFDKNAKVNKRKRTVFSTDTKNVNMHTKTTLIYPLFWTMVNVKLKT